MEIFNRWSDSKGIHHHNHFTALFPGPPGWAGARRGLLDFMVQGKINRGRCRPSGWVPLHLDQPVPTSTIPQRNTVIKNLAPVQLFGRWWCWLWPPYRIEQAIIFSSRGFFFFLVFFIPRLISAVADWMSTILRHRKYRTQKIAICTPSHNFVGPYFRN